MNSRNFMIGAAIAVGLLAALCIALNIAVNDALLGMALISYPFQFPNLPRLMPCPTCLDKDGKPISTVHRRTPSGEWVCWCGTVADQETDVDTSLKGSE